MVGSVRHVRALGVRPAGELLPRDEPLRVGNGLDPLADLLRQLDDDSLRAADVAEPVAVLVALHLADEFSAAGSEAGNDGVDVLDGTRRGGYRACSPARAPTGRVGLLDAAAVEMSPCT
jgi:hypothetical protein